MSNTIPATSSLKPTPNNLTEVRFGPTSFDFTSDTPTGGTIIGQLEYDQNIFVPFSARVVLKNALGTSSAATVTINSGTSGQNLFPAITLPTTPIFTGGTSASPQSGRLSQVAALNTAGYNGYVIGGVPVGTNGSNGAASIQSINVVVAKAVPALATTYRARANNIATLTVSSVPTWLIPGVTLNVLLVDGASTTSGYNGTVTVLSTTSTTFTYYTPVSSTEATTADTAGRVGALTGDIIVSGLLF